MDKATQVAVTLARSGVDDATISKVMVALEGAYRVGAAVVTAPPAASVKQPVQLSLDTLKGKVIPLHPTSLRITLLRALATRDLIASELARVMYGVVHAGNTKRAIDVAYSLRCYGLIEATGNSRRHTYKITTSGRAWLASAQAKHA